MYQRHSQQRGPPQPSSNRPGLGYQQRDRLTYPPPGLLHDELVSAMATRRSGDMDRCLMDRPNPSRMSGSGGYSSNQPRHQQGMDRSNYPHPSRMSTVTQQQQAQSGHGAWMQAPGYDPPSPQTRGSHGGGGVDEEDEDELDPENLSYILQTIRAIKSKSQNSAASSSYSQRDSGAIHDISPPPARSFPSAGRLQAPEVPGFRSAPQTAANVIDYGYDANVIDYGHGSQATDDRSGRESMAESWPPRLQPFEPNKHVDLDYCGSTSGEVRKKIRLSPPREFPPPYSSGLPDGGYRMDGPRPSPSSETWNDSSSSSSSRHPVPKPLGTTKIPTHTMICDYSADTPKAYPHTCSLCEVDCKHAKDWIDHVRSLKHLASCRDLRTKYPAWKARVRRQQDGGQTTWHAKERSQPVSRPPSWSPKPGPLPAKPKIPSLFDITFPPPGRPMRERSLVQEDGPPATWHAKESPRPTGDSSRGGLKRPHDSSARAINAAKPPVKTNPAPGSKITKPGISEADETCVKVPPAKKLKKVAIQGDPSSLACLVYLTGIPTAATLQEVEAWVRGFGKVNNVVLLSASEEDPGQKASVCMERQQDALALAQCSSLSIRDQPITATLAKRPDALFLKTPEAAHSTADIKRKSSLKRSAIAGEDSGKSSVLISGLPDSGWSESDVIKACRPFGALIYSILVRQLGKAVLLMPEQMAEQMVQQHSVSPLKINGSEVEMILLDEDVTLNTPVALYNLMFPPDTGKVLYSWNRLLVVRNVPDAPSAPSEVQKLVERIGKVHNTLLLSHNNMIICEMLSAAAVKRAKFHYRMSPVVLQRNPLFFQSRPDSRLPGIVWGPRWLLPWMDSPKDSGRRDIRTPLKVGGRIPSPDDDQDSPTVDQVDVTLQGQGKSLYLEELCYEGKVFGVHCNLCDRTVKGGGRLSTDPQHMDNHLNSSRHRKLSVRHQGYVVADEKNLTGARNFYCRLCNCSINHFQSTILHLSGQRHFGAWQEVNALDDDSKAKEEGEGVGSEDEEDASGEQKNKDRWDVEVGGQPSNAAPAPARRDPVASTSEQQEREKAEYIVLITTPNGSPGFFCKLCSCSVPKDSVDAHANGEPHAIRLQLLIKKDDYVIEIDQNFEEVRDPKGRLVSLRCRLCEIYVLQDIGQNHADTPAHKRLLELKRAADAKPGGDDANDINKSRPFYCRLCVCSLTDINSINFHIMGKKHVNQLAKIRKHGRKLGQSTEDKTCNSDGAATSSKEEAAGKESPAHAKDNPTVPPADKEDSTPQQSTTYDYLVDVCYDGTAIDFFCTLCETTLCSREATDADSHHREIHEDLTSLELLRGKKREIGDAHIDLFKDYRRLVEADRDSPDLFYCVVCKVTLKKVHFSKYTSNKVFHHLIGREHIGSLWKNKLTEDTDTSGVDTNTCPTARGK